MANLFRPFEKLNFRENICFLSGEKLTSPDEEASVFPQWLLSEYKLEDQGFKMLDESVLTYKDIKIPCSQAVFDEALEPLELEIRTAFLDGYDSVIALPELRIFQWTAKLVYGVLHKEIRTAIRQESATGEEFYLSESLQHKFANLHIMLQSLMLPMEFEGALPWTIKLFRLAPGNDQFSYRDEVNTLTFSLRMRDFGMIVCLQDNGTNGIYHQQLLAKLEAKTLATIQFEEICGKFFYSNYLFNRLPEYTIIEANGVVYIEPLPLRGASSKPLFDEWQNKVYGQVLENFWRFWGFSLFEIIRNPESPMTFLFDENGDFRTSGLPS